MKVLNTTPIQGFVHVVLEDEDGKTYTCRMEPVAGRWRIYRLKDNRDRNVGGKALIARVRNALAPLVPLA